MMPLVFLALVGTMACGEKPPAASPSSAKSPASTEDSAADSEADSEAEGKDELVPPPDNADYAPLD